MVEHGNGRAKKEQLHGFFCHIKGFKVKKGKWYGQVISPSDL